MSRYSRLSDREKIRVILGDDIRFDGHFDKCFCNMKEGQKNEFLKWIIKCDSGLIGPIQSKKDKETIGFVKKIGSNLRAILTKRKQGYFLSLFLDKHKYYDAEMERVGF